MDLYVDNIKQITSKTSRRMQSVITEILQSTYEATYPSTGLTTACPKLHY